MLLIMNVEHLNVISCYRLLMFICCRDQLDDMWEDHEFSYWWTVHWLPPSRCWLSIGFSI